MARALVTGANGFVGRATVAALLEAGWDVSGTVRSDDGSLGIPVSLVSDIGSMTVEEWRSHLTDVDVVVHLAGRAHVLRETMVDPLAEFRRVNREGSQTLMKAAIACGVKRLVFASSIGVNGDNSDNIGFSEDSIVAPRKNYAVSKHEAELGLQDLAAESEMELVIVRPPLVYGAGVKGNFLRLLGLVAKGWPLPLGSTNNLRTMVAVENLASFFVCCVESPQAAGEIFLVGDNESLATGELVKLLGQGMNRTIKLVPVPPSLAYAVAKGVKKEDLYNQLFGSLIVRNHKAKEILGWSPIFRAEEKLLGVGKWFQDHTGGI
jgi:nucleoside-diphosphate-sugar epimerase